MTLNAAIRSGRFVGPSEILSLLPGNRHRVYVVFQCPCGNQFKIDGSKDFHSEEYYYQCLPCRRLVRNKPNESHRMVLRRIKADAKERGLAFEISLPFFIEVSALPCQYCKRVETNEAVTRGGNLRYNGLDRVDNKIGYIESNCVPCCKVCNRAKSGMTVEAFYDWIDALVRGNS